MRDAFLYQNKVVMKIENRLYCGYCNPVIKTILLHCCFLVCYYLVGTLVLFHERQIDS